MERNCLGTSTKHWDRAAKLEDNGLSEIFTMYVTGFTLNRNYFYICFLPNLIQINRYLHLK